MIRRAQRTRTGASGTLLAWALLAAWGCPVAAAPRSADASVTPEHRRARHCEELTEYANQMAAAPRHAASASRPLQAARARRRSKGATPPPQEAWPGIMHDSSRWLDKSKEERDALRRLDRARQGIGLGGIWLDDQHPMDVCIDDWLAAREMLGLKYDGDLAKEPEIPRRASKATKRLVSACQKISARGDW